MNKERFDTIKLMVKEKFEIEDEGTVDLEDGPGQIEYLVFDGPLGKMKLEGITKPAIENTKVIHSKRIGSASVEQNVYSDTEEVFTFIPYKWDEDTSDWQEIEASNFDLE